MRKQGIILGLLLNASFIVTAQTNTPWTTTGPIGIGTSVTNNAPLTINQNSINQLRLENDASGKEAGLRFRSKSPSGQTIHADLSLFYPGSSPAFIGFKVPANNTPGSGYKMVINSNGKVGIGTSFPSATLDVNSNEFLISKFKRVNSGGGVAIAMENGSGAASWSFGVGSNNHWGIWKTGQDLGSQMILLENGNMGIGTNTPDAKLTVKGDIHAERVKVDLNIPVPDYVFEEDYDLRSLEETASYIQAHKHLPEVPSAKELESNGVDLVEMNMLLLKKIEELTLHVIELKKENNALQKEVKNINSKINK